MKYFCVGNFVQIGHDDEGPIKFQRFGQSHDLPDDVALEALKGRAAILPESQWLEIGFTVDEVRKAQHAGFHANPTAEFDEKRRKAWAILPGLHSAALTPAT